MSVKFLVIKTSTFIYLIASLIENRQGKLIENALNKKL
jgi:hypothetical protein